MPVVPPAPAPPRTLIDLAPGVRVDRRRGVVEVYAVVCIETGLLEQIACAPQTREHEALVSVRARPRDVHAGLLLLGLAPGRPGWWKLEGDRLMEQAPDRRPSRSPSVGDPQGRADRAAGCATPRPAPS
ncbi:MAG: YdjY domain-containing protein [Phycisphaerales bacterium]